MNNNDSQRIIAVTGATGAQGAALGQTVRYNDVPPEVYRGFGFEGADDLGNMYQFKRDFNEEYCAIRSVARSRMLNPRLQTLNEWLERNKDSIPL